MCGCVFRWSEFARDGAPWDTDEEEWLYRHCCRGTSLAWLSVQLSRTQSAVRARVKLRRNNPALPSLILRDLAQPVLGASPTTLPAACVRSGLPNDGAGKATRGKLAAAPSLPATACSESCALTVCQARVVECAKKKLLKCALNTYTGSGVVLLACQKLSKLVASAHKHMLRASSDGDVERHAIEAAVAAAIYAISPPDGGDGNITVVRVDGHMLEDAVGLAVASYFEYVEQNRVAVRLREQKVRGALDGWTTAFQKSFLRDAHNGVSQAAARSRRARPRPALPVTPAPAPAPTAMHVDSLVFEAPPDLESLSDGKLRAFIVAANGSVPAAEATRTELQEAAAAGVPAWEVKRLLGCAALPEPQRYVVALRLGNEAESVGSEGLERRARVAARKLCLLTHPDKSLVEGSNEAFMIVQRALQHFQCVDA